MIFQLCLFISLWQQNHCDGLANDFNVDIPSYDEYSEWEPIPTFVLENNSKEKITEDLSAISIVHKDKLENTKENKIQDVFLILEEIKERLEVINEPLKVIKEHLNDRKEIKEPLKIKKELLEDVVLPETVKETLEDIVLPETVKETLEDVVLLDVINEPMVEDGKDVLERDCFKDDDTEKVSFAGPVKAKGTVSVGANFGYESFYPISYPYYPPFFYGPFYYPPPYYFPHSPPLNPHDIYVEILKTYLGIPSKHDSYHSNREIEDLPDCNPEGSEVASYWPTPGNNEPKAGKFGGFVPANGRISIATHF